MPLFNQTLRENIRIAWLAIGSQKLRAVITVSIIALGIMALVAMITATAALENKVNTEFSRLGSNTFTVSSGHGGRRGGHHGEQEKENEPIGFYQAEQFKDEYRFDAVISMTAFGSGTATVKYLNEKTNPNIRIIGCDEPYLELSGYELEYGRNFSPGELEGGANVVIIGADVAKKILKGIVDPTGREVYIGSFRYEVIGLLKSKGNTFGMAGDDQCMIPVSNVRKNFATKETEYALNVRVNDVHKLDAAMEEAYGIMRVVRGDKLGELETFELEKSDQMAKDINDLTSSITIGGTIIGMITLLGAAIGLMNIMLVSVTERTKEIGTRKAIGASSKTIRSQFLIESIMIGQIGGFIGILLGIVMGNVVSYFIETSFTIPWMWIILGFTICFFVSVISGYYPARKASKLDPIEALRYE